MLSAMISRVCNENRIPSRVRYITEFDIGTTLTFTTLNVRLRLACRSIYLRYCTAYHCDSIRNADGIVLPCKHALLLDRVFDNLPKIQHWMCDYIRPPSREIGFGLISSVTHSACFILVSYAPCIVPCSCSLARISLPPNRRNTHVGACLHGLPIRYPSGVEHSLSIFSDDFSMGFRLYLT